MTAILTYNERDLKKVKNYFIPITNGHNLDILKNMCLL